MPGAVLGKGLGLDGEAANDLQGWSVAFSNNVTVLAIVSSARHVHLHVHEWDTPALPSGPGTGRTLIKRRAEAGR